MDGATILAVAGVVVLIAEVAGIWLAIRAIMSVRTPQGAVAWSVSLVAMPLIAVPLYLVFGRERFHGDVDARRAIEGEVRSALADQVQAAHESVLVSERRAGLEVLARLAELPFSRGNATELLIDGEATFGAIFAAIDAAERFVLVQFFIVRDDGLGRELKARLEARARAGVAVHFLYDEIGCHALPPAYVRDLRAAGVQASAFNTTRGSRNRFQLNFRNHRKIVVIDGMTAFIGGHNVGDEYMGRSVRFGAWRDTHVRITGPAALAAQLAFTEDWDWATRQVLELDWPLVAAPDGDRTILILPSGPADAFETCGLFFADAIHAARQRLWIASPYFVPDSKIVSALQLAALRGVDVRIMLPARPDHYLVYLASFASIPAARQAGVRFFRYDAGFLHQKVMLVDDVAVVGTANLDNRSFRLNFEVSVVVDDAGFAAEVQAMLERDFANCHETTADDFARRPLAFRVAVRAANLMAPIL